MCDTTSSTSRTPGAARRDDLWLRPLVGSAGGRSVLVLGRGARAVARDDARTGRARGAARIGVDAEEHVGRAPACADGHRDRGPACAGHGHRPTRAHAAHAFFRDPHRPRHDRRPRSGQGAEGLDAGILELSRLRLPRARQVRDRGTDRLDVRWRAAGCPDDDGRLRRLPADGGRQRSGCGAARPRGRNVRGARR